MRATREPAPSREARFISRCYHHKRNETSVHWTRSGHRGARCGTNRGTAGRRPRSGWADRVQSPDRLCPCSSRPQLCCWPTRRASRGADEPECEPGNRRIPAPVPPRGRHSVARGHRRFVSVASARLWSESLASLGRLLAYIRSPLVLDNRNRCDGLSLSRGHFVLASEAPLRVFSSALISFAKATSQQQGRGDSNSRASRPPALTATEEPNSGDLCPNHWVAVV
jgi:hypothetical protein